MAAGEPAKGAAELPRIACEQQPFRLVAIALVGPAVHASLNARLPLSFHGTSQISLLSASVEFGLEHCRIALLSRTL
jgi:hypothetical protein